MKHATTAASAMYTPQSFKTFVGALCAFFEKEFPQMAGKTTRLFLANSINDMVLKFYPDSTNLKPGQMPWVTVNVNEKGSYGKTINNTELVPVVLNIVNSTDVLDRAEGKKLKDIKKEATVRIAQNAYKQGGCMTNAELAIILKISPNTVSKYIKEWELEYKTVVPRRGSIHDMGPTLTHKKIIIHKLFVEQKSVQQTSRETYHSLPAIERYITAFRQILLCKNRNMSTEEIAYATKKSIRLVKQYEDIIKGYEGRLEKLKEIIEKNIHVESNSEVFANEYGQQ